MRIVPSSVGALGLTALACAGLAAAAFAGVVKYDTSVTIVGDAGGHVFHGFNHLKSEVSKCERGRRVILFKRRPGADRQKLGTDRTDRQGGWLIRVNPSRFHRGDRIYAKARPKVGDGYVCLADRSRTLTWK